MGLLDMTAAVAVVGGVSFALILFHRRFFFLHRHRVMKELMNYLWIELVLSHVHLMHITSLLSSNFATN